MKKRGIRADKHGMAKVRMSGAFEAPKGKIGDLVFVRLPGGGASMRDRAVGANPRTAAQRAWREAIGRATRLYQTLDEAEHAAWTTFVTEVHEAGVTPSLSSPPRVYNIFVALTAKFIALSPDQEAPRLPPASLFMGDGISVSAAGEDGAVRFTASGPNASQVTTELLLQWVPSPGRRPTASKYRIAAVHAFASAGDSIAVPSRLGVVYTAIRFVSLSSGQSSGLVPLGRVIVG